MNIVAKLDRLSQPFKIVLGFILIGAVGVVDYLTGYQLAFSLFYVLPILFVTWLTRWRFGIMASVISAVVWLGADVASGHSYVNPFIPIWNTLIRLSFFLIIAWLLSALKIAMEGERDLARVDYLTGAVNSRFFYVLAQMEIDRFIRYGHPFTLAYIDLDNFKSVNDRFGHTTGDRVLRIVVDCVRRNMRTTDVVARLGGDEFALLLPETDPTSANAALNKIRKSLLEEMRQNDWPVTFSIGVLTCRAAPTSTDELVRMADELMYTVKHEGKNAVRCSTYSG
jgi:diguanylate cyclase (GGDEF)-like protein